MVHSCSAYNCTNRQGNPVKLQFHTFPLKNKELCDKWILAIRRKNWKPTKFSYVCGTHFKDEDYRTKAKRYLEDFAVPSIFNFPCENKEEKKKKKQKCSIKHEDIPLQETVKVSVEDRCVDTSDLIQAKEEISVEHRCVGTSDIIEIGENNIKLNSYVHKIEKLEAKKKQLQRKVKLVQQQLHRKDKKVVSLEEKLAKEDMKNEISIMMNDKLEQFPVEFLMTQFKNSSCSEKGKRYSKLMKEFAVTLYTYSPNCYMHIRKQGFQLPHPSVIRHWIKTNNCDPALSSCASNSKILNDEEFNLDEPLSQIKKTLMESENCEHESSNVFSDLELSNCSDDSKLSKDSDSELSNGASDPKLSNTKGSDEALSIMINEAMIECELGLSNRECIYSDEALEIIEKEIL